MQIQVERHGARMKKILLLLQAGITVSLTKRPDVMFTVIRETSRELKEIDQRALQRAIKSLYRSKLVSCQEHADGTIKLVLTEGGRKQILRYNLRTLAVEKPVAWDGWWRLVVFDIPERLKKGRDALANKLKELGFHQMQKSVFILPYECKDAVDFIVEVFELRPHVRFLLVKETDIDLALKHVFSLK